MFRVFNFQNGDFGEEDEKKREEIEPQFLVKFNMSFIFFLNPILHSQQTLRKLICKHKN